MCCIKYKNRRLISIAKLLRNNSNIVINKLDKSNGVLVWNRAAYVKIRTKMCDNNTFKPCINDNNFANLLISELSATP